MQPINTPLALDGDQIQFLRTYCRGIRDDLSAGEIILVADGDRELLKGSTLRSGIIR